MDLKETGYDGVDWFHSAQDREQMAGSCEHGNILPSSYNARSFLTG
jgi:hypothetical protein